MDFRQNKTKHTGTSSPPRYANYKPAHGNVWMPRINYHITLSLDLLSRIYLHLYTCFWNNTYPKCELIAPCSSHPPTAGAILNCMNMRDAILLFLIWTTGFFNNYERLNMKCKMHRVLPKHNSVVTQIEGARVYKRTQLNNNNELINCLTAHKRANLICSRSICVGSKKSLIKSLRPECSHY